MFTSTDYQMESARFRWYSNMTKCCIHDDSEENRISNKHVSFIEARGQKYTPVTSPLFQVMSSKPMLIHIKLDQKEQISINVELVSHKKVDKQTLSAKLWSFCPGLNLLAEKNTMFYPGERATKRLLGIFGET